MKYIERTDKSKPLMAVLLIIAGETEYADALAVAEKFRDDTGMPAIVHKDCCRIEVIDMTATCHEEE